MKKTLGLFMAAATALSLSACKPDNDTAAPDTNETASSSAYNPERLITVEAGVTRNNVDFTVALNAYCNRLPLDESYGNDCAVAATLAMQQKFMCNRFALAAGNTRSDSEAVLSAGLQGTYNEFPSQYLFTQEKLEARVEANNRAFNKDNFFVITGISDIEAAAVTFPHGIPEPNECTPA